LLPLFRGSCYSISRWSRGQNAELAGRPDPDRSDARSLIRRMSRRILDLSTLRWQLGQAPRQPFLAAPADDRAAVAEWLPAAVPGDVRADLIAAGRIPLVETPEGIAAGAWVDDCDWWYRAELPPLERLQERPEERPQGAMLRSSDEIVVLEADGIDYCSAIWLDNRLLATHAGMFARQTVVLPFELLAPGQHELAVRVWGGSALPALPNPPLRRVVRWLLKKISPGLEYFPDRLATPKAQFGFGWDFSPRLLSAGIWDGLRLVAARGVYIEYLRVRAEPLSDGDPTPTRWRLRVRLHTLRPLRLQAEVVVERESAPTQRFSAPAEIELRLAGAADFDLEIVTPGVRRWWPWDQGEPCLYHVTVRLSDEAGPMDEISRMAGVRTVARTALPDGSPWQFQVNGRAVFLRGANWVPADVLPGRVGPKDYARLLAQARDAGINFLRVWGGGVREKAAFWELCDRQGIMAWQEFPLACAFLDHYPREQDYLMTLASEARGIVRALRNHPSLITWSGGNEINPNRERLPLGAIEAVLQDEDPDRPWIPASPSAGELHQWQTWHGYAQWIELAETQAPFMSEFGMQALPDAATLREMFADEPPASLADPRWASRKAQVDKLRHYACLDDQVRDVPAAIRATQRVQAAALQAGVEACRLRRGQCGGVAFWQFNEPWPAVSWSVIDRYGRPKAAYEVLRHSCQPVLVALRFASRPRRAGDLWRAEVWLVNDGPARWEDCQAEAALDGELLWTSAAMALPAASALCAGAVAWAAAAPERILRLRLHCGEVELASNAYDLGAPLAAQGSRIRRWRQGFASRLLQIG
jgi:beta-mannosidase